LFNLDPEGEPYSVSESLFFNEMHERTNLFSFLYFNGLVTLNEKDDSKPKFTIPNQIIRRNYFVKMKETLELYKEKTITFLRNPNEKKL